MKKVFLLFCLVVFSFVCFSQQSEIIPLSVNHNKLEFKGFLPTAFSGKLLMKEIKASNKVIENLNFSSLEFEGFVSSGEVGKASIPVLTKMIEVPYGAEIQVVIKGYIQEVINLSDYGIGKIEPVQPSYNKSTPIEEQYFVMDENYYNTDIYDADDIIKTDIYGDLRGVRIGSITIRPYHYNPVENTLIIYNDLDFEINFVNADLALTDEMKNKYYSAEFDGAYSNLINYTSPATKDQISDYSAPLKYVIVANTFFQSTLQPFVQWKRKQGFNVIEHYVASGTTNTSIKTYLQSLYNSATSSDPAPTYCLIIGDHSGNYSIPAFATKVSGNDHITDLYFATFGGASDYLPDMYYGRISAETTAELTNALDKILPYEQYTLTNFDYLDNSLLVAGVDASWANKCGNAAVLYGVNNYFNTSHGFANIYAYYYNTTQYPYAVVTSNSSGASSNINSKIASGVGFGNYTAHCDYDGWADPAVKRSNIANWANKNKYPFLIGNCCLSFQFNKSDAFGEMLLYTKDAGAVGYIGTTNYSYWYEDTYWGIGLVTQATVDAGNITNYNYSNTGLGFMDGIFHEHVEAFSDWYYTAAQIITCGNLAVQASSQTSLKQYYWEIYHVSGDPSLMPYMSKPDPLTLSFSNPIVGASSLIVNTEPYTYVAISKNNVLLDAKWSGANNTVTLSFPALTGENYCIVGTKQDRSPYINESVIPTAPNPPIADFNANPTSIIEGEQVNFTDASQFAATWNWNFGDGQTSSEQNPSHIYTLAGIYSVSLTVTNPMGNNTKTKTNYITVNPNTNPPTADFSANTTIIAVGTTVNFTDLSTNNPLNWEWEFEGGTPATSSIQNPNVIYNTPGSFNVKLTVTNNYGSDDVQKTAYITVQLPDYCAAGSNSASYEAISNFTCNTINNSSGKTTYSDFTNISTDLFIAENYTFSITSVNGYSTDQVLIWCDWNRDGDFTDDGENLFTSANGAGPYSGNFTVPSSATPGPVRVRIRLYDTSSQYSPNSTPCGNSGYGEVEDYTFNLIDPNIPPTADFTVNSPEFCSGEVSFTDQSNFANSWLWNFGDGNSSSEQNPIHNYNSSGSFTVSLTVSNDYGTDTKTINNAVIIDMPEPPTTIGASACGSSNLTLTATGDGSLAWYNEQSGGTPINTGSSYTSNFSSTTNLYVESQITSDQTAHLGPETYDFATGGFFNSSSIHGLIFNAEQDFKLVSVVVRSSNSGNKTITLKDNQGNTIANKVVYVTANTNFLVNLDFDVPAGTGYKLLGNSTNNLLYRNTTGAVYPYTLDGVVSIVGNTAVDGPYYYYYFYDWVVEYEQHCTSPRSVVTAIINPVPSIDLGEDQTQCGGSIILDAGAEYSSYLWNDNSIAQTLEITSSGTYSVTVENEYACTASDQINIGIYPSFNILLIANDESSPNENDGSINLTLIGGTPPFTYEWSNGSINQNIENLSPGNYCVTVIDANSCSNSSCVNIETVGAPPTANFEASQTQLCDNYTVNFADLSQNNPTLWVWDFGDGQTSTEQNPIHTYATTGIYSVSLTVSNENGENSLTKTDYIKIGETPSIILTAIPVSWDETNNGSVNVIASGGTPPYSYEWNVAGNEANLENLAPGEYCVSVTEANYCQASDCITLSQESEPILPISDFQADQTQLCDNYSVNFADLSQNEPISWAWNFGDGQTSSEQNPTHTYATTGIYSVSLTVSNEIGENSLTKTEYIKIGETPSIILTAIPVSWDETNNGSVNISVSGGTPPYSYEWNVEGNLENLAPGEYCVTVTEANYCQASDCITLTQEEAPAFPIANFSVNTSLSCLGSTIQFYDLSTNQPNSWTWSFGDGQTSDEQNPSHVYENSGFYSVSLTIENQYGSDEIIKEDYIYISTPPSIDVEVIHASGENIADGSANLIITGGTAPYQIVWSNNSNGNSIENLLPGNYSIMLIDAANCVETMPFVVSWVSIAEQSEAKINIYPNPAKDFISVEIQGFKADRISLTNILGQEISQIVPNSNISTIDIKDVESGIYLVKISSVYSEKTYKVVIKK